MKETTINVNGTKIVSFHGGEGPELVLLPSGGGRGKEFLPLFNLLSSKFAIFTLDYPGFGRSEEAPRVDGIETLGDFIQSWVKTLKLNSFFLAGFSMGGALALQLALKHPSQIKKLSLIATVAGKLPHVKIINPAGLGMKEILNKFYFRPEVKERIRREKLTAEEKREIHRSSQAFARMAAHKMVFIDIYSRLPEIQIPCLVLGAAEDQAIPPPYQEAIFKELPQARLKIYPESGHFVIIEKPEEVAADLTAFFC